MKDENLESGGFRANMISNVYYMKYHNPLCTFLQAYLFVMMVLSPIFGKKIKIKTPSLWGIYIIYIYFFGGGDFLKKKKNIYIFH